MKDKSMFSGIKELGVFRFEDYYGFWRVFKSSDSAYILIGVLKQTKESNLSLYKRAVKLNERDN
jgi:hypothetical protein